jgi:hypothetical protein
VSKHLNAIHATFKGLQGKHKLVNNIFAEFLVATSKNRPASADQCVGHEVDGLTAGEVQQGQLTLTIARDQVEFLVIACVKTDLPVPTSVLGMRWMV